MIKSYKLFSVSATAMVLAVSMLPSQASAGSGWKQATASGWGGACGLSRKKVTVLARQSDARTRAAKSFVKRHKNRILSNKSNNRVDYCIKAQKNRANNLWQLEVTKRK